MGRRRRYALCHMGSLYCFVTISVYFGPFTVVLFPLFTNFIDFCGEYCTAADFPKDNGGRSFSVFR